MSHPPLSPIPVLDVSATIDPGLASAIAEPDRLGLLLDSAYRAYTATGVRFGNHRSRVWSARSTSPYAPAVGQIEAVFPRPGAFMLNYSYEWGCTAAAVGDDTLGGTTLVRSLDWPFDGLGRALVVVRHAGPGGSYLSATWPGYVGVLTGVARGRFAASINQPPLPLPGWGKAVGWMASRLRVNRSPALPPSHLLRRAFDTCRTFDDAVSLIRDTPICLPAIFTLAGPGRGEAIVIERVQTQAYQPAEAAAANHWASQPCPAGRPRNPSSLGRRTAIAELIPGGLEWSLSWLRPPILQPDTRLAMLGNPRTGRLLLQGWEKSGPATEILDID